jgi:hypothetical protein
MMIARAARMIFGGVALAGLVACTTANAAEADFFSRFEGSFAGGGQVIRNAAENPNNVQCTLTGKPHSNGVTMSGKCGAFIFSKQISAQLKYNPATHRYTGVYVGSSIGPASLSGRRKGDAVVLTITWPQPVNGDNKAIMTIHNSGNGRLAITVTDKMKPGGRTKRVTDLALAKL